MITTLYKDKWLAVNQVDGWYNYVHETVCDGKKVAVLGFDLDKPELRLVRVEKVPCWFEQKGVVSLTGSIEKGHDEWETAIKEVKEESGYEVVKDDLMFLGKVYPYKASDALFYLFAVDLTEKVPGEILGDGTKGEEGTYCEWVDLDTCVASYDPLLVAMIMRFDKFEE